MATIFDTVSNIGAAIDSGMMGYATKFVDDPALLLTLISFAIAIEIIMSFIEALSGSGTSAVQRGIEALLFTALIAGVTQPVVWKATVIPIYQALASEAITTATGLNSGELNSEVAKSIATAIRDVMNRMPSSTQQNFISAVEPGAVPIQKQISDLASRYVANMKIANDAVESALNPTFSTLSNSEKSVIRKQYLSDYNANHAAFDSQNAALKTQCQTANKGMPCPSL